MLRLLVGLLVVANLVFFAWSEGALDPLLSTPSLRAGGEREPERLKRQLHPETIRVLPADAASRAAASALTAASAVSCLEAGPFATDADLGAAQAAVAGLVPADAVESIRTDRPGSWIVYAGRYATPAALQRKEDELTRRGVAFDELAAPDPLAPGLALGRFPEREAADQALVALVGRGVRNLRVVAPTTPSAVTLLRIARADAAVAERLRALAPSTLGGASFTGCTTRP